MDHFAGLAIDLLTIVKQIADKDLCPHITIPCRRQFTSITDTNQRQRSEAIYQMKKILSVSVKVSVDGQDQFADTNAQAPGVRFI